MKDLKTLLERKDDSVVTLPGWASFLYIDVENEKIEFLDEKEVKPEIKEKAGGYGQSINKDGGIYVCVV